MQRPACALGVVVSDGGDDAQGLRGVDDANAPVGVECEQVVVAGDDEIGACGDGAGEHGFVVGIAANALA
jgi:hypothetical protein